MLDIISRDFERILNVGPNRILKAGFNLKEFVENTCHPKTHACGRKGLNCGS